MWQTKVGEKILDLANLLIISAVVSGFIEERVTGVKTLLLLGSIIFLATLGSILIKKGSTQ